MKRFLGILTVVVVLGAALESARAQGIVTLTEDRAVFPASALTQSNNGQVFLTGEAPQPDPAYLEPTPEPADGPWTIWQPRFLEEHRIKTGGWIQQGITFNAWNPQDRFNGPVTTNDRHSEYMLNQFWLFFDRPTQTDGEGFDWGGRVDVVYGEDWRYGQNVGLEDRINSPNNFYGLVLPQFYLEVAYNDLTVKMGHFATFTSLELIPAPANFFYSRSYLMAGYLDPLLVTGLQADYKLNNGWTLVGGFNRGWMLFENPFGDTLNFLGGLRWASEDKRTSVSTMVSTGPTMTFTGYRDVTSVFFVVSHQFTDRFWSGTQITVGGEPGGSAITPGDNDAWYGFEEMFTYKLNPKWSTGLRYEWVQNNEGSRVAGIGNIIGSNRGWTGKPGYAGSFSELSLGLNYRPHPNFNLRPEVRWDWYNGPVNPNDPTYPLPFGDGQHSSQFTTGLDLLVTY